MENVLGVALLLSSLSDNEHAQLLMQMIKTMSRKCLENMLFQYMISINQKNDNTVREIKKQINCIIQKREQTTQQQTKSNITSEHTLDRLPMAVISEMGVFLNFRDFFKFQMTNRTIYIGLNSPTKIHHIHVKPEMLCTASEKVKRFRFAKSLDIAMHETYRQLIYRSTKQQQTIWNDVQQLELITHDGNPNKQIHAFIASNICSFDKMRSFSLNAILEHNPIEFSKLEQIIDKAPNLKSLTLDFDECYSTFMFNDSNEQSNIHLEHLTIYDQTDFTQNTHIIRHFKTEHLISFTCDAGGVSRMSEEQQFDKLETLKIIGATNFDFEKLIKKQMPCLKKIDISVEAMHISPVIGPLFDKQSIVCIKYISLDEPATDVAIIQELNKSLLRSERKRTSIIIELNRVRVIGSEILFKLLNLISTLYALFNSNFVMKLQPNKSEEFEKWLDGIRTKFSLNVERHGANVVIGGSGISSIYG